MGYCFACYVVFLVQGDIHICQGNTERARKQTWHYIIMLTGWLITVVQMDNQVFLRLFKSKASQHTKRRQAAFFGVLLSAACKYKLSLVSSLGLLNLFGKFVTTDWRCWIRQHVLIQRQTGLYRYEQAAGPTLFVFLGIVQKTLYYFNWMLSGVSKMYWFQNSASLILKVILSQYEGVCMLYNLPNSILFLPFYPFWWVSAPNHKTQIWLMTLTRTLRICLTLTNIWRHLWPHGCGCWKWAQLWSLHSWSDTSEQPLCQQRTAGLLLLERWRSPPYRAGLP